MEGTDGRARTQSDPGRLPASRFPVNSIRRGATCPKLLGLILNYKGISKGWLPKFRSKINAYTGNVSWLVRKKISDTGPQAERKQ